VIKKQVKTSRKVVTNREGIGGVCSEHEKNIFS
jgi:hypothetical protein